MKTLCSASIFLALVCTPIATTAQPSEEDFRSFLLLFFSNMDFQQERIQWPLEHTYLDWESGDADIRTVYLDQRELGFSFRNETFISSEYHMIIYDSFDRVHRATSERVVAYEGNENGINVALFFERKEGLWYLIRYEDVST